MNETDVKELFASVAAHPAPDRIDLDAVLAGGRRRHRTRVAATLGASLGALAVIGALMLSALPGASPDPAGPTPTSGPTTPAGWGGAQIAVTADQAQEALVDARAMWAAGSAATGDYRLTVRRSSSAAPVRAESEVSAGEVTAYDVFTDPREPGSVPELLPDARGDGLPRTVPDLLDLVASYADAAGITVVFDRFGVPVRIDVDPQAGAVDDESTLTVSWSGPGSVELPDGSGPWSGPIAWTGPYPTKGLDSGVYAGSRAVLVRDARGAGVYLTVYGSSTCPSKPSSLTMVAPSGPGPVRIAAAEVVLDWRPPREQGCTMDLAPSTYWAPLPEPYASTLPLSPSAFGGPAGLGQVELVLTQDMNVLGGGVWVSQVQAVQVDPAGSS